MKSAFVIGLVLITQIISPFALSAFAEESDGADLCSAEGAVSEASETQASAEQASAQELSYDEVIKLIPNYQQKIQQLKEQLNKAELDKDDGHVGYSMDLLPGGLAVIAAIFFGNRAVTGEVYHSSPIGDLFSLLPGIGTGHGSWMEHISCGERFQAALIGLAVSGALAGITVLAVNGNHHQILIAEADMAKLKEQIDPLQARLDHLQTIKGKVDAQVANQKAEEVRQQQTETQRKAERETAAKEKAIQDDMAKSGTH